MINDPLHIQDIAVFCGGRKAVFRGWAIFFWGGGRSGGGSTQNLLCLQHGTFFIGIFLGRERERYDLNIYIIINQEILLLYENVKNV